MPGTCPLAGGKLFSVSNGLQNAYMILKSVDFFRLYVGQCVILFLHLICKITNKSAYIQKFLRFF